MTRKRFSYESFTGFAGETVARHPLKIVAVFLLIALLMIIPISNIQIEANMSEFYPDSEFADTQELIDREFNGTASVVQIVEAEDGNILDRTDLLNLQKMKTSVLLDPVVSEHMVGYKDPVASVADMVEATLRTMSNGTFGIQDAPGDVLLQAVDSVLSAEQTSYLVSKGEGGERRYALMVVFLENKNYSAYKRVDDETLDIAILDSMRESGGDELSVYSLSNPNQNMGESTTRDMTILLPLSLFVLVLILFISLRSLTEVAISILGLVVTFLISFGLFELVGLNFNQMTFFAPIFIMVLSIDYAIHVLLRYKESRVETTDRKEGMASAIRFVGISVLLSAVTTAVAFASNALSSIPAVVSFGLFLAMGIMVSFAVMVIFVPALRLMIPEFRGPKFGIKNILPRLGIPACSLTCGPAMAARAVYKRPFIALAVVLLITAGSLAAAAQVEKDMTEDEVMANKSDMRYAVDVINEEFPNAGTIYLKVLVRGDLSDPEVLRAMDGSIAALADNEYVVSTDGSPRVLSMLDMIKPVVGSAPPGTFTDADGDLLPDRREEVEGLLETLYSAGVPGVLHPRQVQEVLARDPDSGRPGIALMLVELKGVGGARNRLMYEQVRDDMSPLEDMGSVQVRYAGFILDEMQMLDSMTDGMIYSTAASIILCTVMVMVLFRSPRFGLVAAIPVVLVTFWVLGSLFFLGLNLNPVTATTTAMTVGIGIDYSIHIVERYRQERKKGMRPEAAMSRTMSTTGIALIAAGATTASGFGVIAFSSIGMFRGFGMVTALLIVYVIISSQLVLPSLIMISEKASEWITAMHPDLPKAWAILVRD